MQFIDEINKLPLPNIIEVNDFETLLAENILLAKEVLGSDWNPLESDQYMKKLRVLTLRQMHNQADKNETIKQLLITTATGVDLDHLGLEKGIVRAKGEKPRALFRFTLTALHTIDKNIPKGTVLNSKNNHEAFVLEDLTIPAGEMSVEGYVELQIYVESTDVVTENIVTDLSFIGKAEQLSSYIGGYAKEDDNRYRERIILSNATYSTAGAIDAYIYYAISADSRIKEVVVLEENVLDVNIYLTSATGVVDSAMIERVAEALNVKSVRPLGDNVIISQATYKHINIDIEVQVFDLLKAKSIETEIRKNLIHDFKIGENFVRTDLVSKCRVDGVYDIVTNFENVICADNEVVIVD
ncbi:MAG TPA: hypothetical protein EYG74_06570, partial [Sulfurimonas autotrophica]|nr:hypothetical protein [Sulfurimonas autotrophica]